MYEIVEHTADVGLRIHAPSLPDLLADAARGLFSVIIANPEEVRTTDCVALDVHAQALDDLLHDWLAQLLFIFETRRLIPAAYEIRLIDGGLTAELRGERLDHERHETAAEVKAITYHGLKVEQTADGWLAEVVLDL